MLVHVFTRDLSLQSTVRGMDFARRPLMKQYFSVTALE